MPDFSAQQLSRYLADIWICEDLGHHPDVNIVLGHKLYKQSENNYDDNGKKIDGRRSTLLTDFVKEEPIEEEENVHKLINEIDSADTVVVSLAEDINTIKTKEERDPLDPSVSNSVNVEVEDQSLPEPQTERTTFIDIKSIFEDGASLVLEREDFQSSTTNESDDEHMNKSFPIFDKCYHGSISTQQAEDRLRTVGMESSYLTIESNLQSGRFILSSISNGNIKHSLVPDLDGNNKKQASFIEVRPAFTAQGARF